MIDGPFVRFSMLVPACGVSSGLPDCARLAEKYNHIGRQVVQADKQAGTLQSKEFFQEAALAPSL